MCRKKIIVLEMGLVPVIPTTVCDIGKEAFPAAGVYILRDVESEVL